MSKTLFSEFDYFNYDFVPDRLALKKYHLNRQKPLLIFDEIHKMPKWKQWLKGLYDTQGIPPRLLVTGSAKLDTFKKVGDSLAGRFFQYRLYPFDLKELSTWGPVTDGISRLLTVGNFPEPYLENDPDFTKRWQRTHIDIMLRQDFIDTHSVHNLQQVETLIALLRTRVGACISYSNLAQDLNCDPGSVKRWLQLLESFYVIFAVTPYAGTLSKSIRKQPKYYFYDTANVEGDDGAKFENLVANALLKNLHFKEDTKGIHTQLHYIKTKDGKEVDFAIIQDKQITHLIEAKWRDAKPSHALNYFKDRLQPKQKTPIIQVQAIRYLDRDFSTANGIQVCQATPWLETLAL